MVVKLLKFFFILMSCWACSTYDHIPRIPSSFSEFSEKKFIQVVYQNLRDESTKQSDPFFIGQNELNDFYQHHFSQKNQTENQLIQIRKRDNNILSTLINLKGLLKKHKNISLLELSHGKPIVADTLTNFIKKNMRKKKKIRSTLILRDGSKSELNRYLRKQKIKKYVWDELFAKESQNPLFETNIKNIGKFHIVHASDMFKYNGKIHNLNKYFFMKFFSHITEDHGLLVFKIKTKDEFFYRPKDFIKYGFLPLFWKVTIKNTKGLGPVNYFVAYKMTEYQKLALKNINFFHKRYRGLILKTNKFGSYDLAMLLDHNLI